MNNINAEYKEKTVSSVVFSCTMNIALTIGAVYLAYLSLVWSYQNWSMITSSVSSFFLIFKPAKDFLVSHIGKLFITWAIITVWCKCVLSKLDSENLMYDTVIIDILIFLVPFLGFIVFGLVPFKLDNSWMFINVVSGIISFALFVFWIGIAYVFLESKFSKKEYVTVMESSPEQLNLDLS